MVPGAQHCMIGFDPVPLLENWVEQGQAPASIVNTMTASTGAVTRALCQWPQTAVYNGTGSTSEAPSFTCQNPS